MGDARQENARGNADTRGGHPRASKAGQRLYRAGRAPPKARWPSRDRRTRGFHSLGVFTHPPRCPRATAAGQTQHSGKPAATSPPPALSLALGVCACPLGCRVQICLHPSVGALQEEQHQGQRDSEREAGVRGAGAQEGRGRGRRVFTVQLRTPPLQFRAARAPALLFPAAGKAAPAKAAAACRAPPSPARAIPCRLWGGDGRRWCG